MYYVYTLVCSDKELYTGCTEDLKDRMNRHQKAQVPATRERLPAELVTYTAITDKYKAFEFEKYLKTGSGRAFVKKHLL
ncbi:MAG: excinuclease ABC subunit C [Candidatus Moranbacteria bacterium RIFCSPLOWO2_02_FULL_48_19]|nr:MAG: excinuclease ABC subunit C [Candidatus Moranbacteria bacterium RIFCSPLOWO2_02_FULL_48_19]